MNLGPVHMLCNVIFPDILVEACTVECTGFFFVFVFLFYYYFCSVSFTEPKKKRKGHAQFVETAFATPVRVKRSMVADFLKVGKSLSAKTLEV